MENEKKTVVKEAKYRAVDIAKFYLQLADDLGDKSMDADKLNYLVYYAQAWSLVKHGRPLFDDMIIAGEDGPVIPAIYDLQRKGE